MAKPKVFKFSEFDLEALLALASRLRERPCSCDRSKPPLTGSLNWVIFVVFDDGVEWAFRSPHTRSGVRGFLSDENSSRIISSEVATLSYVKSRSSIPVPEVLSYSASRDNEVGVPYILMSKASGHSLAEYDWLQPRNESFGGSSALRDNARPLSEEGRQKVMSQLGAITAQLSRLRFDKIGSLSQDGTGNYTVVECLLPSLTWQHRDLLEDIERGPYDDETAYFESLISAYISHAQALSMTPHAFLAPTPVPDEYTSWASYRAAAARWNDFVAVGEKIEHSKNRLAFCVAGQLMREMIPSLVSVGDRDKDDHGFPLSHPDLHFGNIFVDDDLNITCIIDWGSASTVPLPELLCAPGLLHHFWRSATGNHLVDTFRASFERELDGQASVGPQTWKRADMMRLLDRLFRMLSIRDYHDFATLYALAHQKSEEEVEEDLPALFNERARSSENKRLLEELKVDDLSPEEVAREEGESFGCPTTPRTVQRIAVARKLTVAAEINDTFSLADRRLWRWVEEALKDLDENDVPLG